MPQDNMKEEETKKKKKHFSKKETIGRPFGVSLVIISTAL